MKILDKYLIKRFFIPFLATFLVVLFVLLILTMWVQMDKIAGKGLSPAILFKYLGYTTLMVIPQALPIGVLLSSIMALGSLSENYEFAAIKSAGISLYRLLKPLTIFMLVLSLLNFLFLNYVFPFASYESINLMRNIRKKQPAMALVEGSFNSDIPNFSIKFSEKYGEEKNLLKNVLIYDLRDKKFNNVSITAKFGEIKSQPNSKYMTLILRDGYYYKEIIPKRYKSLTKDNMPFINSHFDEHQINFDIGSLDNFDAAKKTDQLRQMMSLKQLKEKVAKDKVPYQKNISNTQTRVFTDAKAVKLVKDTLFEDKKRASILGDFTLKNKIKILNNSVSSIGHNFSSIKSSKNSLTRKKLNIFKYTFAYYEKIAFSLACLVLFLIGAPLGSIIRKGGFGMPMISAVVVFVIYHFIGVLTRGMADTGKMNPMLAAWFSTMVMIPFGMLLINRAVKDKGLFNLSKITTPILNIFKKKRSEIS